MTPKGLVWVHWNGRKLDLRLPPGVIAEVALPGRPTIMRDEGDEHAAGL